MSPELSLRSRRVLVVALAMAAAFGLSLMSPFDHGEWLRHSPLAGPWLAALAHGGAGWWGLMLAVQAWAPSGLRGTPASGAVSAVAAMGVGVALLMWVLSLLLSGAADARALLWLQILPLWSHLARLALSPRPPFDGRRAAMGGQGPEVALTQGPEQAIKHRRVVQQGQVGHTGHTQMLRPGPRVAQRGKHDGVAVAVGTDDLC